MDPRHAENILSECLLPCDAPGRRTLWEDIKQLKSQNADGNWCIMGDFNSIREPAERVSVTQREADSNAISLG